MPQYRVTSYGLGRVVATKTVEASSPEQAEKHASSMPAAGMGDGGKSIKVIGIKLA